MTNRLYCTFVEEQDINKVISGLISDYEILFGKIFVLGSRNKKYDKTLLTYNIDTANLKEDTVFPDTINVHRKKETNTLYTINALNSVVLEEYGRIDPKYQIEWENYRNCLLLSKHDKLITIPTFLKEIVDI